MDRLNQHLRDYDTDKEKYYWNSAVVFIGRNINKAFIRYLENRFVEIARECGRYKVLTKNTYKNTVMKESQIASMEEFINNVKIIIYTLGYKVLEPVSHADEKTVYLYCKGGGSNVKGFVSSGGFIVLKGSKVSNYMVTSFELRDKSYFNSGNKLVEHEIIVNDIFEIDYGFNASSAASAVILGRSNGNIDWKNESSIPLKDINE